MVPVGGVEGEVEDDGEEVADAEVLAFEEVEEEVGVAEDDDVVGLVLVAEFAEVVVGEYMGVSFARYNSSISAIVTDVL